MPNQAIRYFILIIPGTLVKRKLQIGPVFLSCFALQILPWDYSFHLFLENLLRNLLRILPRLNSIQVYPNREEDSVTVGRTTFLLLGKFLANAKIS